MKISLAVILACAVFYAVGAEAPVQNGEYDQALKLYNRTHYGAAVQALLPLGDKDARTVELLGKSYYMLGAYRDATEAFRKAVEADPKSASYYHWLGRAYGRRAELHFRSRRLVMLRKLARISRNP